MLQAYPYLKDTYHAQAPMALFALTQGRAVFTSDEAGEQAITF